MDLITNLQKYTEYSLGKTKEKCSLIYQDVTINNIIIVIFQKFI